MTRVLTINNGDVGNGNGSSRDRTPDRQRKGTRTAGRGDQPTARNFGFDI